MDGFTLFKKNMRFEDFAADQVYDLVYYDAFGARVQPELWEIERFMALYKALRPQGIFVTYAAKGSVRRALQEVGFEVERLPGPPGKREMLRGTKI
jgi:tRNA U34 5-methylaminomethyl-2-thiouridine-forming methyltransferase MnmC